ncbi:hypothetical protein HAX54_028141 [Datura stramonium]|uniref:Myb/SANT-like domain-containing protein n=1 Tax=Datura stramonium TaxID=4076 RepID=A0ABS8V3T7_DATST|nr:hypothetical protein [Datura stramonium]
MEYLMLEILADEVKQGNKSTNQFKAISFSRVSDVTNQQLGMDCSPKHVENHLKTLRSTWNTVQTLLNKSGLGWDDNLKMITAIPRVYSLHIQAHPTHDKFINKKIDMFKEISEKGNADDIEGPSKKKAVVGETSQVKASHKRNRSSDVQDVVSNISTELGEVAAAISKIADSRLDVTKLYEEIMAKIMKKSF